MEKGKEDDQRRGREVRRQTGEVKEAELKSQRMEKEKWRF